MCCWFCWEVECCCELCEEADDFVLFSLWDCQGECVGVEGEALGFLLVVWWCQCPAMVCGEVVLAVWLVECGSKS